MSKFDTDISIELQKGTYVWTAPRSGLAKDFQLHVLGNVIDADYRGPIKVLLQNLMSKDVRIAHG